jgi:hypothetical protein
MTADRENKAILSDITAGEIHMSQSPMRTTLSAVALGAALSASSAAAHHSGAMFEPVKTVTLKGVVKVFEYTNPHSWLWVTVTNDDGTTTDWGFEAEGPSTLFRAGIKKSELKPGDNITITGRPEQEGRPAAAWINAVKADGTVVNPRPQ